MSRDIIEKQTASEQKGSQFAYVNPRAKFAPATLEIPGLTRSLLSPNGYIAPQDVGAKLVIIMVGLPARGKSYIVRKLARYLNWLQHKTEIFNVGERRRKAAQTSVMAQFTNPTPSLSSAAFFDPTDPAFVSLRDRVALETLDELLDWLIHGGGSVGILDATNNTPARRRLLLSHIRQRTGHRLGLLFLESCCFDRAILETNFRLKLSGPDYKDQDPEKSLADFKDRVAHYEKSYVPLGAVDEEQKIPYVQMIDVGRKVNTHLICGFLSSQVVEYLLNFNLSERQIWLSCNGESIDDTAGRIGRKSELSEDGRQYALALASFIQQQRQNWEVARHVDKASEGVTSATSTNTTNVKKSDTQDSLASKAAGSPSPHFYIWTSMMPQTIQTVTAFPEQFYAKKQMKMLDDLNAGDMAGLTFDEIAILHPGEYAARRRYKLLYRYPGLGGEGYVDLINRLRPVIVEVERMSDHLLIITHRAVVRILLAYFSGLQRDDLGELVIPKDSVFCFEMKPYGIDVRTFTYCVESSSFQPVPNSSLKFFPQEN
ncbi:6-phosphofructo-2-kinase [Halenospora varia]|nr:6-phosphofructo-2-kinase [Halenospora varia]